MREATAKAAALEQQLEQQQKAAAMLKQQLLQQLEQERVRADAAAAASTAAQPQPPPPPPEQEELVYVRGNTAYTGTTTAAGDGYYEVFRGVQVGWVSFETRQVVDMQECGLGIWHEECNGRPDALEKCSNPEPPPAAGAVADSNHPAAAGGGGELQQTPSLGLSSSYNV